VTDVSIEMIGTRVLVRPEDQHEHTQQSGVIIVESYAPEVIGTVIACGEVTEVNPGDVVLFTPEAGREMEWGGQKYLVLDEDEILAVWDEAQEPV
jgi:co-chaperonin GroES (HSP10)